MDQESPTSQFLLERMVHRQHWCGIYTFVITVSTRLHPNPNDVPSVALAAPSPKWAAAADQGRQLARAGLVRQNLPGLSVAVGVDGDVVWAEGFGWADMEKRVPVAPGMRFRIGHTSKSLTSARVTASTLVRGLRISRESFEFYLETHPQAALRIYRLFSESLAQRVRELSL